MKRARVTLAWWLIGRASSLIRRYERGSPRIENVDDLLGQAEREVAEELDSWRLPTPE